jgi:hypothetical protein
MRKRKIDGKERERKREIKLGFNIAKLGGEGEGRGRRGGERKISFSFRLKQPAI